MSIRVLLINPPYPFEEVSSPPLGLVALATWIRLRGRAVRIEDYIVNPYSPSRLRETLEYFRPHLVGATAVTMNVNAALAIMRDVRHIMPGALTVMGGPHVTFDADAILKNNGCIDCIVRGEGELTLDELCNALEDRSGMEHIAGLSYRSSSGVIHNPDRPFIENIDMLPVPDRSLAELGRYRGLGLTLSMVTSRGCPHRCVFCVGRRMVGSRVRYFSTGRVLDEFRTLAGMNFPQINIADDLFTSNSKRCIQICRGIVDSGIRARWSAFARVDTINPDLLRALVEAGCGDLCFGMESGNQDILDNCRKGITLEKSRNAVEMCRRAGIRAVASFILGLPGETAATMNDTIEFAGSLGIPYGYHILAPFPGSAVRQDAGRWGMAINTDDWDMYDADRAVCRYADIDYRDVEKAHDDFYDSFREKFDRLIISYRNGDVLDPAMSRVVEGFLNGQFVIRLLTGSLLERYPGMASGASPAVLEDVARFLEAHGEDPATARAGLGRLMENGCVEIFRRDGISLCRWVRPAYDARPDTE